MSYIDDIDLGHNDCSVCEQARKRDWVMEKPEYEKQLRLQVREVVNLIPNRLDTSSDLEEAISLISGLIRRREGKEAG